MVLDLGEDVSSLWSPVAGIVAEPSRVAFDNEGRVMGFGFDADPLAGDPQHQLSVANPFKPGRWHEQLVRSFLLWLVGRSGIALTEVPVFLPLPPNAARAGQSLLCRAVEEMGGDALVIHRPLAAAVALGIEVDEPECHLMAEVSESHIEMAAIKAGSVLGSRLVRRRDAELVRRSAAEHLNSLDPDEEIDVRDRGVYLYGWSAPRHAAETLNAFDLPLAAPVGMGPTVLNGARRMAEVVLPWLVTHR